MFDHVRNGVVKEVEETIMVVDEIINESAVAEQHVPVEKRERRYPAN